MQHKAENKKNSGRYIYKERKHGEEKATHDPHTRRQRPPLETEIPKPQNRLKPSIPI